MPLLFRPLQRALLSAWLLSLLAAEAGAQGLACSNDGRPAPAGLLERFMDADCSSCWVQRPATSAPTGALVLDWVVPSASEEQAAMSTVALPEAAERLAQLALPLTEGRGSRLTRLGAAQPVRVVQGFAYNGYLGATLDYRPRKAQPYTAWLLLVEQLPTGTEGSAVARQLVRAAAEIRPGSQGGRPMGLSETRAFRVPEGAQPERLRVLAWVQDEGGRLKALAQTHCHAK